MKCMKDAKCNGEIHPWAESQKMSNIVLTLDYSKAMGIRRWYPQCFCFFSLRRVCIYMCICISLLGHSLHSISIVYWLSPSLDTLPLRKGPTSISLTLKCPGLSPGLSSEKAPNKDMLNECLDGWMNGWINTLLLERGQKTTVFVTLTGFPFSFSILRKKNGWKQ